MLPVVMSLPRAELAGLHLPAPPTVRSRPAARHPWLLPVGVHRGRRQLAWLGSGASWAATRGPTQPAAVKSHASPLFRPTAPLRLADQELQTGKVTNLRLAAAELDGLVINPGQVFSFNRVVGNCTRRRGYVEGLRLAQGRPEAGVGGGLCQLASLLHWLFLHSPLTILERSEHSYDPFPDHQRTVPWGVGCTIVYNYRDLVVRNDTATGFTLNAWVDSHHLRGLLSTARPLPVRYRVEARDERFFRVGDEVYRHNQIWRRQFDRVTGDWRRDELMRENCAVVRYPVADAAVIDVVA